MAPLINIVLLARDLSGGSGQPDLGRRRGADDGPLRRRGRRRGGANLRRRGGAVQPAGRLGRNVSPAGRTQTGTKPRRRLFCLALIFLGSYVAVNAIAPMLSDPEQWRWLMIPIMSVLFYVGLPAAGAALGRVRLGSGFRLRLGPWAGYLGALLLGLSAWVFVTEIGC